jgi:two-component system, OmpR family, sensor histidine kinase KdpD
MNPLHSWSLAQRYGTSVASIALTTLILIQLPSLHQANIALLYLLVVLISATMIGLGPAMLASILAFLGFNFFFVAPLHTFTVADSQDGVRLLTFLAVAIIASSLAGRARDQAATAQRSATELATLYGLSQTISAEVAIDRILQVVAQTTTHLLNVPVCAVLLYDDGGRLAERATSGDPPPEPVRRIDTFLRVGPRVLGVLRVTQRSLDEPLTKAEHERLEMIASQVVLALERARLTEEASQSRTMAEAERMKGGLLTSVSHDLRTPLAVIKGAVTNLLDDSVEWDSAGRLDLLNAINDEADRLNRLVGNLLEMSRIEAGAQPPAQSLQDIGELVGNVVNRMRLRLAEHLVTINIPADLPAVRISYTQIDQVLTNLLENALKYTPADTPIMIQAAVEYDDIRIEVHDHGPGIPAGLSTRIFEKFVRVAGPERHADGMGLGLAICKGIIDRHRGRIWAENLPTGGARFIFTLPLGAPANGSDPRIAERPLQEDRV